MSALPILAFDLPAPDLGAWRSGNTGTEGVWRFDSGEPGRHVMLSALVHGNEVCGAWALKGLLEAGVRPRQGTLTLAFCNLEAFDRFDPQNHDASRFVDEDLNRQWTDARIDAADTRERRRAAALRPFVAEADWLLDLHSMHEPSAPLLLTGMHPRNLALARALRSPEHVVVDAGHQDGVRMRDYGRFGLDDEAGGDTRSLLVECGFHGDPASRTVAQDQCVRFLEQSGVVDAATLFAQLPGWRLPDAPRQWALEVTGPVVAQSSHFRFAAPYTGLEVLARAGTVIGDNDGTPVATPYDDCVLVMPSVRQARAGVTVVRYARRRPLV
jgi:predicted deacylase